MSTDRNYEIAVARLAGEGLAEIALRFGVSRANASSLAKENTWMVERCAGKAIPSGLTARAAIAIDDAIGVWPSEANKSEIDRKSIEIFRSPSGRRVIMKEIGAWLGYVQGSKG